MKAGLTFANDEAGLNCGNSEGELLQASWWPHVPITMAATSAPASGAWWTTSLYTTQQVCNDAGCVLRPVRRAHDLSNPVWCGAIICETVQKTSHRKYEWSNTKYNICNFSINITFD